MSASYGVGWTESGTPKVTPKQSIGMSTTMQSCRKVANSVEKHKKHT